MNCSFKRLAAAVLALTIVCGTAPAVGSVDFLNPAVTACAAGSGLSFDQVYGVLTLNGEFTVDEVQDIIENNTVNKIVAAETAVFPDDCSELFCGHQNKKTIDTIDLSKANTSNVTNMNGMFSGICINNLIIDDIDTSNVTSMESMFAASQIGSLDLSDWDTSSVTNMKYMFAACVTTDIILTGLDTSAVTNVDDMFSACHARIINLDRLDLSGVTSMRTMFAGSSAEKIILTGVDASNVITMKYAFAGSAAKAIDLSGIIIPKVTDMEQMFAGCYLADYIDLNNIDASSVVTMKNMFASCTSLKTLDLSTFKTRDLVSLYAPFTQCTSLESIDLSGLNTSKVTDMSGLLSFCESLTSVDLSTFDTSNVENMNGLVYGCEKLKDIDLSSFDTSKVTDFINMFRKCSSLDYVDLSGFNTDNMDGAQKSFEDSTALQPSINTVKSMSIALDGTIGVNYYVELGANTKKVVLDGPDGEVVLNDLEKYKSDDLYKFTYSVNSIQMSDKVTIRFFDDQGRQLIALRNNGSLLSYAKAESSVRDYLDAAVKADNQNDKLISLANALNNYGYAAENYFKGSKNTVNGIAGVDKASLQKYKPSFGDDVKFSLVLDSATSARIYTNSDDVLIDGKKITSKTSKYGKFYEIADIPAHKLGDDHTVSINGKSYSFNLLAYSYRALANDKASAQLSDLAKALYIYADAAKTYIK